MAERGNYEVNKLPLSELSELSEPYSTNDAVQDAMSSQEFKEEVKRKCMEEMSSKDFIMEPSIFSCLRRYFQVGGIPEKVVKLLSDNYTAVAQTVNLLAEWLIMLGLEANQVQDEVENHLKDLLLKHFDPVRADEIFRQTNHEQQGAPTWLKEMVAHKKWRQLFYQLAAEYPDCAMLSLTIKLISDDGNQAEITNVSTACTQLEVFSHVLRTGLSTVLKSTSEEELEQNLPELAKMVCHAEHTYLYSQVVISVLAQEKRGRSKLRRISQEIQKYARNKGHDVTQIILALSAASNYPRTKQSIMSMLNKGQLNPGDVTVLHQDYSSKNPPPVNLIQLPLFLDMFVSSLFTTRRAKINPGHLHKYVFILAYAASVSEIRHKGKRQSIFDDELQSTSTAIDEVHQLVLSAKGQVELLSEMKNLYLNIKYPVVAMGVLKWIEQTVSDAKYFERQMDHTPLHLILLDEVVTCHDLLHRDALKLLVSLFERTFSELDTLVLLELKKTVLDRMVHLMIKGCVLPVVSYIRDCSDRQDTDASLIRYFVTEVLDIISPPYSSEFINNFLPIIENENIITSDSNYEGNDPVSDFIEHCKSEL